MSVKCGENEMLNRRWKEWMLQFLVVAVSVKQLQWKQKMRYVQAVRWYWVLMQEDSGSGKQKHETYKVQIQIQIQIQKTNTKTNTKNSVFYNLGS